MRGKLITSTSPKTQERMLRMSIYKPDDLGFDLEIRKNIFVDSHIYPAKKKIIVSFLEQLDETDYVPKDETINIEKSEDEPTTNPIINEQDTSRLNIAVATKQDEKNDPIWHQGFLQRYYDNGPDDYKVESISENLEKIAKHIKNVVSHVRDYDIEFENLAIQKDFLKFSKRYGINDNQHVRNNTEGKKLFGSARVVYDTDDEFDPEKHGLRIGYNTSNYDETMIAHYIGDLYFSRVFDGHNFNESNDPNKVFYETVINQNNGSVENISAESLTDFNSQLFTADRMPNVLGRPWEAPEDSVSGIATYQSWERSNRYVDVAKLNPKFISLKRCAMALGYKIQESDTNRDPTSPLKTFKDFADLIAYNVNDIYVTLKIFESGPYYNRYLQNTQLLKEFPYMVYAQTKDAADGITKKKIMYETGQDKIRKRRLTTNDTSTKFVETAIAPYPNTKIKDNPTLNLNYPDQKIATELEKQHKLPKIFHGKSRNALDIIQELLDIEKAKVPEDVAVKVQKQYDKIKQFYGSFIGKNFNDDLVVGKDTNVDCTKPSDMDVKSVVVKYVTKNGTYTDNHGNGLASYVNISIGGTHGVEVLQHEYEKDLDAYYNEISYFEKAIDFLNDSGDFDEEVTMDNLAQCITKLLPDEPFTHVKRLSLPFAPSKTFGDLLLKSASRKKPKLKNVKKPNLFETKDGKKKLKDKYSYTSSDGCDHEDFDSYYPALISQLAIFRNVDGDDVFTTDLYHPRLKIKKLAKDKTIEAVKRAKYMLRQLSMKLLINAASGGGDATFTSNIKCNNKMLAMRIIGQLFCWYIGQTLALHDARIPSTNTDGLYSMNLEQDLNDNLVVGCAKNLLLKIDPEDVQLFVSKDANNRLEKDENGVAEARGSSLTSWQGPSTQNSIAHPAVVDYVLAQYLAHKPDAVNQEFDTAFTKKIFAKFVFEHSKYNQTIADTLRFFQFPIVANPKTARFLFESKIGIDDTIENVKLLNATNRIFLAKKSASDITIKSTGLQTVNTSSAKKREPNAEVLRDIIKVDPVAEYVIKENASQQFYKDLFDQPFRPKTTIKSEKPRDLTIIKITDLPLDQPVIIHNEDLHDVTQTEYEDLLQKLDMHAYLDLVQNKFETQWQNHNVEKLA
jgi:hypothetical protein